MDPITLGVISMAGTVLSAGVGVMGAMQTASANQAAAQYQSQVAANNKIAADQNAVYAEAAGGQQAQAQDMKTRAIMGEQLAGQSASGIDVESPSSRDVRSSAQQLGRLDSLLIKNNADLTARGYQVQAANFGAESQLKSLAASNYGTAGGINAFSTILGGATSFSDKWLSFQQKGINPFG